METLIQKLLSYQKEEFLLWSQTFPQHKPVLAFLKKVHPLEKEDFKIFLTSLFEKEGFLVWKFPKFESLQGENTRLSLNKELILRHQKEYQKIKKSRLLTLRHIFILDELSFEKYQSLWISCILESQEFKIHPWIFVLEENHDIIEKISQLKDFEIVPFEIPSFHEKTFISMIEEFGSLIFKKRAREYALEIMKEYKKSYYIDIKYILEKHLPKILDNRPLYTPSHEEPFSFKTFKNFISLEKIDIKKIQDYSLPEKKEILFLFLKKARQTADKELLKQILPFMPSVLKPAALCLYCCLEKRFLEEVHRLSLTNYLQEIKEESPEYFPLACHILIAFQETFIQEFIHEYLLDPINSHEVLYQALYYQCAISPLLENALAFANLGVALADHHQYSDSLLISNLGCFLGEKESPLHKIFTLQDELSNKMKSGIIGEDDEEDVKSLLHFHTNIPLEDWRSKAIAHAFYTSLGIEKEIDFKDSYSIPESLLQEFPYIKKGSSFFNLSFRNISSKTYVLPKEFIYLEKSKEKLTEDDELCLLYHILEKYFLGFKTSFYREKYHQSPLTKKFLSLLQKCSFQFSFLSIISDIISKSEYIFIKDLLFIKELLQNIIYKEEIKILFSHKSSNSLYDRNFFLDDEEKPKIDLLSLDENFLLSSSTFQVEYFTHEGSMIHPKEKILWIFLLQRLRSQILLQKSLNQNFTLWQEIQKQKNRSQCENIFPQEEKELLKKKISSLEKIQEISKFILENKKADSKEDFLKKLCYAFSKIQEPFSYFKWKEEGILHFWCEEHFLAYLEHQTIPQEKNPPPYPCSFSFQNSFLEGSFHLLGEPQEETFKILELLQIDFSP